MNTEPAPGEGMQYFKIGPCRDKLRVWGGEPAAKADRVLDDRRREAMSVVGELIHAGSLTCRPPR